MHPAPEVFLAHYDDVVFNNAMLLRKRLHESLPGITEQVDISAKMIAFCYGQRYADLICTIIPSRKGLKLGFNRGNILPDPEGLLKGSGKISRYVVISDAAMINTHAIKTLLAEALNAYKAATAAK